MQYIFRLATILVFVLVLAATDFAVVNPNTKSINTAEKQTKIKKYSKHHRHSSNKRRTSMRRPYRLTESQRRYYNQALRNIFIN